MLLKWRGELQDTGTILRLSIRQVASGNWQVVHKTVVGPKEVIFGGQELESLRKDVQKGVLKGLALARRAFPFVSLCDRKRCFWLVEGRAGCRAVISGWNPSPSETRPAGRVRETQSADLHRSGPGPGVTAKVPLPALPTLWHLTLINLICAHFPERG